jgi:hypothetical protein
VDPLVAVDRAVADLAEVDQAVVVRAAEAVGRVAAADRAAVVVDSKLNRGNRIQS